MQLAEPERYHNDAGTKGVFYWYFRLLFYSINALAPAPKEPSKPCGRYGPRQHQHQIDDGTAHRYGNGNTAAAYQRFLS
jgi:hypothetical protein